MLANYMQVKTQQQMDKAADNIQASACLTLSYDLENYYSLLSHIAQDTDQRWILFIAPPGKPNFTFLQQAGIHKNRIIVLRPNNMNNPTKLLKTALKSHNYSTVITWLTDCDKSLQNEINALSAQSQSCCFVYCTQ